MENDRQDHHRDGDISASRVVGITAVCIIFILGLTWIFQGNDFFLYKVFAPKYEATRRETFEQSKAYNQGTIQELQRMRFEYIKAKPEQKEALASVILHQAADFDEKRMPDDLREFINQLKRERELAK